MDFRQCWRLYAYLALNKVEARDGFGRKGGEACKRIGGCSKITLQKETPDSGVPLAKIPTSSCIQELGFITVYGLSLLPSPLETNPGPIYPLHDSAISKPGWFGGRSCSSFVRGMGYFLQPLESRLDKVAEHKGERPLVLAG